MSAEEKSTWIYAVVGLVSYATYVTIILGRAENTPLAEVPYVATLLWTIGIAIAVTIFLSIVVAIASPKEAGKKDQRDREINRFGEYIGQSLVVVGAVAALIMAMAEVDYFWIANAIALAFFLSGVLASVTKIVAYRRGFQQW